MTTAARLCRDQLTMACSMSIVVHIAAEFFGEQHLGVLRNHRIARLHAETGRITERVAQLQNALGALPAEDADLPPFEDAHFASLQGFRLARHVDEGPAL